MSSATDPRARSAGTLIWAAGLGLPGLAAFAYNDVFRVWRVGGSIATRLAYVLVPLLLAWVLWRRGSSGAGRPDLARRSSSVLLLAGAAVFAAGAAALASWLVFDHVPHVQDELSYDLQARIFARGHLTAPVSPGVEFFDPGQSFLVVRGGRWYSLFPPGNALLLSLGARVGLLRLVNPLLAALAVLAVYALGREAYDRETGRAAAVLLAFAPGLAFMAGSLMSHTAVLALAAAGMAALFGAKRRNRPWLGALSGACFGTCSLIRPLDGGLLALAATACLFWRRPRALGQAALLLASFGLIASVYLLWNWATNGDPLLPGHRAAMPTGVFFGLGRNAFGGLNTLPMLAWSAFRNLAAYVDMFWGWPVNLFLVLATFGWIVGRPTPRDWFFLGLYGLFAAVFLFYYHPGLCLGARYFWPTLPGMALLLARLLVPGREAGSRARPVPHPTRLAAVAVLFCVLAWAFRAPAWAWEYRQDFWKVSAGVGRLADRAGVSAGLVFIHEGTTEGPPSVAGRLGRPLASSPPRDLRWYNSAACERLANTLSGMQREPRELSFRSGMICNTPWPTEQRLVFLLDLGERNRDALRWWPGLPTYLVYCDRSDETYVLCPYEPPGGSGGGSANRRDR